MSASPIGHKCQASKFCGMVLVAYWRKSRFSSQSVLVFRPAACTHWLDSLESQAFGRAFDPLRPLEYKSLNVCFR